MRFEAFVDGSGIGEDASFDFVLDKEVAGAASLRTEGMVFKFIPNDTVAMGMFGFVINSVLDRGIIGNTKVDFGGASLGDSEASGTGVGDFAGFDIVDDDVKLDIFDGDSFVEFCGDFVDNFDINTFDFAAVIKFERGEESVGFDDIVSSFEVFDEEISAETGGKNDKSDDDNFGKRFV